VSARKFFSLLIGLIIMALIISGLLIYRDHHDNWVTASDATLNGTTYAIGIDYSGVMTDQEVQKGQFVQAGQLLGLIKSGTLIDRLHVANLSPNDLPYTLNKRQEVELHAANAGVVQDVNYIAGSFVPANQQIYVITDASQYYATAKFNRLTRQQVRTLTADKIVQLAYNDGTLIPSRIRSINIKQTDYDSYNVELESVPVTQPDPAKVKVGEPLNAVLILQEQDTYTRVADILHSVRTRLFQLLHH
jgi:hypothetical protein